MDFFMKWILPVLLIFFMFTSYFTQDKLFMLIMALGNMVAFWLFGAIYVIDKVGRRG